MPRVARISVSDRPHRNIGGGRGFPGVSASGTKAETHAEISIMSPEPHWQTERRACNRATARPGPGDWRGGADGGSSMRRYCDWAPQARTRSCTARFIRTRCEWMSARHALCWTVEGGEESKKKKGKAPVANGPW